MGYLDAIYDSIAKEQDSSGAGSGQNNVTLTEEQLGKIADAVISKLNNAPDNKEGSQGDDAGEEAGEEE